MTKIKREGGEIDLKFLLEKPEPVFDFRTATDDEIVAWMNENLPETLPQDRRDSILEQIHALKGKENK